MNERELTIKVPFLTDPPPPTPLLIMWMRDPDGTTWPAIGDYDGEKFNLHFPAQGMWRARVSPTNIGWTPLKLDNFSIWHYALKACSDAQLIQELAHRGLTSLTIENTGN